MAIEKQIIIDQVEVVSTNVIQVRQATKIIEDGVELSKTYHRWLLEPGQDISNQDPKVQAIANAVWTPEVIAEFEKLKNQDPPKLNQ